MRGLYTRDTMDHMSLESAGVHEAAWSIRALESQEVTELFRGTRPMMHAVVAIEGEDPVIYKTLKELLLNFTRASTIAIMFEASAPGAILGLNFLLLLQMLELEDVPAALEMTAEELNKICQGDVTDFLSMGISFELSRRKEVLSMTSS
jgi:hypothetical protein